MSRLLLILLLTPLLIHAQQPDIRIKKIRESKGRITVIPAKTKWLTLGGNYTSSAATASVNPTPYNDNIFRTTGMTTQSLTIQANIKNANWRPLWAFTLKAATTGENLVIPENRNTTRYFSLSTVKYFPKFSISGSYNYFSSRFSYDNSTGFLNRAYQNALLSGQWSTLKNDNHPANKTQQTANLAILKKQGPLSYALSTTADAITDNGIRYQNDLRYSSNAWLAWYFPYHNTGFSSTAKLNYIYTAENVRISYPASPYTYNRSSNDASLTLNSNYGAYNFTAGLNAGNKFYLSNTSLHNKFLLPEISGFIAPTNLFDNHLNARFVASYTIFCSELPINHSLSAFTLTQLTPQEAYRFMPATEVSTYTSLAPMQHREFSTWTQLEFGAFLSFRADFSVRDTKDNVFPAYVNNQLVLLNLADTRYKGFEMELQFNTTKFAPQHLSVSNSISFYRFSNIVTRVRDGYNNHPIAGFSTIYKALVVNQPLGVLMTATNHSVLGNPTPDYTLKITHLATWRAFSANLNWEYRKGGDIWNGTAAALTYYGAGEAAPIQKGDNIRIHTLSLAYDLKIRRYLQRIRLTAFAQNLLVWSAYKGADPNQLLYDQPGSNGLDFFNLPSTKIIGAGASLQF